MQTFRGKGVDVLLGHSIITSALNAGFPVMDSHHELEQNVKMRAEMERIGRKVYRRFQIYRKTITY